MNEEVTKAEERYMVIKVTSQWHRQQFLLHLAKEYRSTERARIIKSKLRQEQTKREWQTIKKASGALQTKSITAVEIMEKGREVRTKGKEDTERAILD